MEEPRRDSSGGQPAGPAGGRPRVVVADDDVLLREGLCHLLAHYGYQVVGQAGDGAALLELVARHRPDVVVVDTRMPPTYTAEGLRAAVEIRRRFPRIGIVVLSAHVEVAHAMELMAQGDRIGYLLKSRATEVADFLDALRRVAAGGSAVDASLVRELVGGHPGPPAALGDREREVLALMAQGCTDTEIAGRLGIGAEEAAGTVRGVVTALCLPLTEAGHHRVLAVLAYLDSC
ncbi:putative two-component system response regulator, LuxR family protein [Sphaerisporangium rufum]|uniref:Two-component system response regulator, LuxR family protein n=1 Tax=Sphaerisporangium rufum TaxID=1381558 RepID=A0A919V334_9ACTN|nr:response regulator transcription factor [Sphaerisporangium rufum]GII80367.1 putative two-component system response regulator, LuxR family protein [Sphaerisporangium rufum]